MDVAQVQVDVAWGKVDVAWLKVDVARGKVDVAWVKVDVLKRLNIRVFRILGFRSLHVEMVRTYLAFKHIGDLNDHFSVKRPLLNRKCHSTILK